MLWTFCWDRLHVGLSRLLLFPFIVVHSLKKFPFIYLPLVPSLWKKKKRKMKNLFSKKNPQSPILVPSMISLYESAVLSLISGAWLSKGPSSQPSKKLNTPQALPSGSWALKLLTLVPLPSIPTLTSLNFWNTASKPLSHLKFVRGGLEFFWSPRRVFYFFMLVLPALSNYYSNKQTKEPPVLSSEPF